MSIGLLALLDDIAAMAKVAAATLDDVVGQAAKAGAKAAGVVIDDAAVTPRYVVGFSAKRELPIVARIAMGSLQQAPHPAARRAGAQLFSSLGDHAAADDRRRLSLLRGRGKGLRARSCRITHMRMRPSSASVALNPQTLEDEKVAGAIKTDFILSAEIMAITLASIPESRLLDPGIRAGYGRRSASPLRSMA